MDPGAADLPVHFRLLHRRRRRRPLHLLPCGRELAPHPLRTPRASVSGAGRACSGPGTSGPGTRGGKERG